MKCNAGCTFADLTTVYDEKGGKFILHCRACEPMADLVGEYPIGGNPDFQCKLAATKFIAAAKLEIAWLINQIAKVEREQGKNQEVASNEMQHELSVR